MDKEGAGGMDIDEGVAELSVSMENTGMFPKGFEGLAFGVVSSAGSTRADVFVIFGIGGGGIKLESLSLDPDADVAVPTCDADAVGTDPPEPVPSVRDPRALRLASDSPELEVPSLEERDGTWPWRHLVNQRGIQVGGRTKT